MVSSCILFCIVPVVFGACVQEHSRVCDPAGDFSEVALLQTQLSLRFKLHPNQTVEGHDALAPGLLPYLGSQWPTLGDFNNNLAAFLQASLFSQNSNGPAYIAIPGGVDEGPMWLPFFQSSKGSSKMWSLPGLAKWMTHVGLASPGTGKLTPLGCVFIIFMFVAVTVLTLAFFAFIILLTRSPRTTRHNSGTPAATPGPQRVHEAQTQTGDEAASMSPRSSSSDSRDEVQDSASSSAASASSALPPVLLGHQWPSRSWAVQSDCRAERRQEEPGEPPGLVQGPLVVSQDSAAIGA